MEKKTVVVTGIGGNVGQGIVRNLRHSGLPIRIVGTNVTPFSPGNHLVDAFHLVPFSYDDGFFDAMVNIAKAENADLIIPSTDYEVYYLSIKSDLLPCPLACSGPVAAGAYLDKFLTWQYHTSKSVPFAESYLPSQYHNQFKKAIAKPRKGRGSRGILKGNFDVTNLKDDEYMVQQLHEGEEITTAVYRSYLSGKILGLITMVRSLEHGTTTYSRVLKQYDEKLMEMADQMIRDSDLKGSFNIQSIVNEAGEIIPFEINCRISGTNSIRTHFGFKDVEYTVRELLYKEALATPQIIEGVAQRILMDVIYPGVRDENQLTGTNRDNFLIF